MNTNFQYGIRVQIYRLYLYFTLGLKLLVSVVVCVVIRVVTAV